MLVFLLLLFSVLAVDSVCWYWEGKDDVGDVHVLLIAIGVAGGELWLVVGVAHVVDLHAEVAGEELRLVAGP